jgi:ATP-dependent Zn protease
MMPRGASVFYQLFKKSEKILSQGLKPPKGVLLYGPPGTGKTLLAKAMAGKAVWHFSCRSQRLRYQVSGLRTEAVRELFKRARRYAPAIIFIDEIDAVGRKRGQSNTSHGEEMALNALLTKWTVFGGSERPVFVLAATNFDVEEGKAEWEHR